MSGWEIDASGGSGIRGRFLARNACRVISNGKAAAMKKFALHRIALVAIAIVLGSAAITTDAVARGGGGGGGHGGAMGGGHFGGGIGGGHIGGGMGGAALLELM